MDSKTDSAQNAGCPFDLLSIPGVLRALRVFSSSEVELLGLTSCWCVGCERSNAAPCWGWTGVSDWALIVVGWLVDWLVGSIAPFSSLSVVVWSSYCLFYQKCLVFCCWASLFSRNISLPLRRLARPSPARALDFACIPFGNPHTTSLFPSSPQQLLATTKPCSPRSCRCHAIAHAHVTATPLRSTK